MGKYEIETLVGLVERMRYLQSLYFETRNRNNLTHAKRAEAVVDRWCAAYRAGDDPPETQTQSELF